MTAPAWTQPFRRTRLTWQAYLMISYYSYLLNGLGPLTPFLRDELRLSFTVASFHFSAYAIGVMLTGLALQRLAVLIGVGRLAWAGALGISAGALLLMVGRTPAVTITGALLMGLLGASLIAIMNSTLAELHGPHSAVAFAESSVIATLLATLVPLAIGFFGRTSLTWRAGFGLILLALPILWLAFRRSALPAMGTGPAAPAGEENQAGSALPLAYWLYWGAILLAVAIEFCTIFWAANYLEAVADLPTADAALGVSAFLGAMLAGRVASARLLTQHPAERLLPAALLLSGAGYLLFWLAPRAFPAAAAPLALAGLVIAGLGVAGQFPMINAQALRVISGGRMVEASGRISLAVGLAIFSLPLLLGRLADWAGIWSAFGLVVVLVAAAVGLSEGARRAARVW
jgi:fucose permease